MTVIVKDSTGELSKFYNATVELRTDKGTFEVRYADRRGSERLRTYILQNLVSYETFIPMSFDEEVHTDDNPDVGK